MNHLMTRLSNYVTILLGVLGVGIIPGLGLLAQVYQTTPVVNSSVSLPAQVWIGTWLETRPRGCLREANGFTRCYAVNNTTQVFAQGETVYSLTAAQVPPALARCEQTQCLVYGVLADRANDQWQTLVLALSADDRGWFPDQARQEKTRNPGPPVTPETK